MVIENYEKERFKQVYETLKMEVLEDPAVELEDVSRQWLSEMMDYNVLGGKQNRGLLLLESYKYLHGGTELSDDEFFEGCVVAWCMQWAIACALVLDDVADDSHTRRGKPCWFRVPKVGMKALNDGTLLFNQALRILKKHFRDKPCYVDLLEFYNEITYQSACGQLIDLITPFEVEGEGLMNYTAEVQRRIHQYKTAFGGFYAPFAGALLLLGKKPEEFVEEKNILLEIGIYFQVQDDYLDCFGDPEKFGKVGTDIEEQKCSWLVVKALELCNEEQKKLLYDNYKKADPTSAAVVKSLYKELNLEEIFAEYEADVYEKLAVRIEALPSQTIQELLKSFLNKIYKRQK